MPPAPNQRSRVELELDGLHCAGCVNAVEAALRRVSGVQEAHVNLATQRATVWLDAAAAGTTLSDIVSAVRSAGYEARLHAGDAGRSAAVDFHRLSLHRQRVQLVVAALLGMPVMAAHLAALVPSSGGHWQEYCQRLAGVWWWQAALTVAVLAVAAGPMILGATRAVLARTANMDLLVTLGAVTAVVSGVVGGLMHAHELLLFDAAVMIVLFVGLGKYLEAKARRRASSALMALLTRLPSTTMRVRDNQTETVPLEAVCVGDRLRLAAHSGVPVDGEVLVGTLTVDESMLTGESLPVERSAGQQVLGGTRVMDGLADIRATSTGQDSAAARIARLVEQAQAIKPPWQRFADRAAALFVPSVIVVAVCTFVGWKLAGADTPWALQRMIATLVVACPCALGLAIPTAVLVGTTRAASHGILVRDAEALEAAAQVRIVLLDKTGTLTLGRPVLEHVELCDGTSKDEVLVVAAALEQFSSHPFATAILEAARVCQAKLPPATDLQLQPGGGVCGLVDGKRVVVGSSAWLRENGIDSRAYEERADAWAAKGMSVVWVAVDGRVHALLALADQLHPEAPTLTAELRELNVKMRILSGDRHAAVAAVADRLGIAEYEAQLAPEGKLQRVRELAQRHRRVAMVGDGINDAPALAAAHVGIAIGTGADVAREAADICLVGHAPRLIAKTIRISRASARVMKQNLFWAAAYNAIMLPLAMLAPLPPALATAAMMASSLTVVANALRLRHAG